MKNNNINADHLIEILKVDGNELPENFPVELALEHDDIVTQYTKNSIGSC